MKELPEGERPRERLLSFGPEALSDAELLATILGTGDAGSNLTALDLARKMLRELVGEPQGWGSLRHLAEASPEELASFRGVGCAKAASILAAIEMGKRVAADRTSRPMIHGPADVAQLLAPDMARLDREHFRAVLLDSKNRVIAVELVTIGGLDSSAVHPREVFKACIRRSAAAVILTHNHPSGDPTPSPQDVRATRRMIEAGRLLGIEVLDHVIIGDGKHYSLRGRGMKWDVGDGESDRSWKENN